MSTGSVPRGRRAGVVEQAHEHTAGLLEEAGMLPSSTIQQTKCAFCGKPGHRRLDCREPHLKTMLFNVTSEFNHLFRKVHGVRFGITVEEDFENGDADDAGEEQTDEDDDEVEDEVEDDVEDEVEDDVFEDEDEEEDDEGDEDEDDNEDDNEDENEDEDGDEQMN